MTDKPRKIGRKKLALMRAATARAEGKPYRAVEARTVRKSPPITLAPVPWKTDETRKP